MVAAGVCSGRAVCRILRLSRSTYWYRGRAATTAQRQLWQRLRELSDEHPRYGYRRIAVLLRDGNVTEARVVIEDYRHEYNQRRPHSRLEYQSPARFAAQLSPSPSAVGLCPPSVGDGQTRNPS